MSGKYVRLNELRVNGKQDLYNTILCKDGMDGHGSYYYEHKAIWEVINDPDTFVNCLDMLTEDEVYEWRGECGENIVSSLAKSGKPIDCFRLVLLKIGEQRFYELLTTPDKNKLYPISLVRDRDAFVLLLDALDIDATILRQICRHNNNEVVDHLANMINSVSSIDVAQENGMDL